MGQSPTNTSGKEPWYSKLNSDSRFKLILAVFVMLYALLPWLKINRNHFCLQNNAMSTAIKVTIIGKEQSHDDLMTIDNNLPITSSTSCWLPPPTCQYWDVVRWEYARPDSVHLHNHPNHTWTLRWLHFSVLRHRACDKVGDDKNDNCRWWHWQLLLVLSTCLQVRVKSYCSTVVNLESKSHPGHWGCLSPKLVGSVGSGCC